MLCRVWSSQLMWYGIVAVTLNSAELSVQLYCIFNRLIVLFYSSFLLTLFPAGEGSQVSHPPASPTLPQPPATSSPSQTTPPTLPSLTISTSHQSTSSTQTGSTPSSPAFVPFSLKWPLPEVRVRSSSLNLGKSPQHVRRNSLERDRALDMLGISN